MEVLTKDEARNLISYLGFKSSQKFKNQELELQLINGLIDTAVSDENQVKNKDLL